MPSGRERREGREECSEREGGVAGQDEGQETLRATDPKTTAMRTENEVMTHVHTHTLDN